MNKFYLNYLDQNKENSIDYDIKNLENSVYDITDFNVVDFDIEDNFDSIYDIEFIDNECGCNESSCASKKNMKECNFNNLAEANAEIEVNKKAFKKIEKKVGPDKTAQHLFKVADKQKRDPLSWKKIKPIKKEVEEENTTSAVAGYNTPYAFKKNKEDLSEGKSNLTTKDVININIKEINRMIKETEKKIRYSLYLKQESGFTTEQYWKPTREKLITMSESLLNIAKMIRELKN
jgi:hypothetical protein